jgi:hypothetical protein
MAVLDTINIIIIGIISIQRAESWDPIVLKTMEMAVVELVMADK